MTSPIGNNQARYNFAGAFTLIELTLVILLISVLVGLSTPSFRGTFSNLQLKNSVSKISGLIDYAQEISVIQRKDHRLNFDFKEGSFWLTSCVLDDQEYDCQPLEGKYAKVFKLPGGVEFSGFDKDITNLTFYPDGSSDEVEFKIKAGKDYSLLKVKGLSRIVEVITGQDE